MNIFSFVIIRKYRPTVVILMKAVKCTGKSIVKLSTSKHGKKRINKLWLEWVYSRFNILRIGDKSGLLNSMAQIIDSLKL